MCFATIVLKKTNSATCFALTKLASTKSYLWEHFLALIKFALIKRHHFHMCNKVLPLFGKMPQWNLYINCNVNGTRFQSSLTFHTGLSSLRVSCKRALRSVGSNINWLPPRDLLQKPDQNDRMGIVEIHFAVRHYEKIDKITLILTSSELTYYQTYTIRYYGNS